MWVWFIHWFIRFANLTDICIVRRNSDVRIVFFSFQHIFFCLALFSYISNVTFLSLISLSLLFSPLFYYYCTLFCRSCYYCISYLSWVLRFYLSVLVTAQNPVNSGISFSVLVLSNVVICLSFSFHCNCYVSSYSFVLVEDTTWGKTERIGVTVDDTGLLFCQSFLLQNLNWLLIL